MFCLWFKKVCIFLCSKRQGNYTLQVKDWNTKQDNQKHSTSKIFHKFCQTCRINFVVLFCFVTVRNIIQFVTTCQKTKKLKNKYQIQFKCICSKSSFKSTSHAVPPDNKKTSTRWKLCQPDELPTSPKKRRRSLSHWYFLTSCKKTFPYNQGGSRVSLSRAQSLLDGKSVLLLGKTVEPVAMDCALR